MTTTRMLAASFMLIAGEASGDRLAAELVNYLRDEWRFRNRGGDDTSPPIRSEFGPVFFGAGGTAMREAGVEIVEDMSQRAVIGVSAVFSRLSEFAALMNRLVQLAVARQPEVIICVDYGGFNLWFQSRIRKLIRARRGPFNNWRPRLVQFVSPQVWASRPGRAFRMERNLDLLISILPFEPEWFAARTPRLKVAFVGHPLIGRHAARNEIPPAPPAHDPRRPLVALLPGSRRGELQQHLPVMLETVRRIRQQLPARFKLVVPTPDLAELVRAADVPKEVEIVVGRLGDVLREATVALSKTGTITLELALYRVPAVTFYKTSWATYWIARQVVNVKWLSMPNLLAGEAVYPEFVQQAATPETLSQAVLALLGDAARRADMIRRLDALVTQLGSPDATARAARAVLDL